MLHSITMQGIGPTPENLRLRVAMLGVDRLLRRVVSERRRSGGERRDLLAMILAAADADGAPHARVRDELGVFLLGGHETTASTLTWLFSLLARHPEVDERLAREIREVVGERRPRLEDVPELRFLDSVIKETLRLYPPIWLITRRVASPTTIGGYRMKPARPSCSATTYCSETRAGSTSQGQGPSSGPPPHPRGLRT